MEGVGKKNEMKSLDALRRQLKPRDYSYCNLRKAINYSKAKRREKLLLFFCTCAKTINFNGR